MSLYEQATGTIKSSVNYDAQGTILDFVYEHQGGDLVVFSNELLQDALSEFLLYEDDSISLLNGRGATAMSFTIIDRDSICALAKLNRKNNGKD